MATQKNTVIALWEVGTLRELIYKPFEDSKELKKERDYIRKDLMNQLGDNGTVGRQYQSLIDDYINLWDIKNELIKDIRERGVAIHWDNGGGQTGVKKNDSIQELTRVNGQMLKILAELGLRGVDVAELDVDDSL